MADKVEKDLNQSSDCSWVRALDANGNPIKIRKSDLFKIISDGVLQQSGVNESIYNVGAVDLNNIKTLCISMISPEVINNPANEHGIFICLEGRYVSNDYCVQFFIPAPIVSSYGCLYFRSCWGQWGNWLRIDGTII